jgi:cyclic pyranopterin phosphate synthase
MPEAEYTWLPREALLSFEELTRLGTVFAGLGVTRLRLTGGEPLIRRDLSELVRMLAGIAGVADLALTTNGVLLDAQAADLRAAGLRRVTVSLDSVDRERYRKLTRRDSLAAALAGIRAAAAAGFDSLKLNTVVMRGVNHDEIAPLLEFARDVPAELRFIEYMDVGGATAWSRADVVSRDEILLSVGAKFGAVEALEVTSAPAQRYRLSDGTVFGVIASTTAPFCGTCDRARLTADGVFYRCLYARDGLDLRAPLRDGASDDALRELVEDAWTDRVDRGAEERLRLKDGRKPLALADELRENPHMEMHTRGG